MTPGSQNRETEFEKRRGISRVEVRHGFAQVHVSQIVGRVMDERLRVLDSVAQRGISIDFLKLTPSGLSFIVPEDQAEQVQTALQPCGVRFTIRRSRSIVLVYAVNIRDEEGMIASVIKQTIATGATVDHMGDMHDRMLMVVPTEHVERVTEQFRVSLDERAAVEVIR